MEIEILVQVSPTATTPFIDSATAANLLIHEKSVSEN